MLGQPRGIRRTGLGHPLGIDGGGRKISAGVQAGRDPEHESLAVMPVISSEPLAGGGDQWAVALGHGRAKRSWLNGRRQPHQAAALSSARTWSIATWLAALNRVPTALWISAWRSV